MAEHQPLPLQIQTLPDVLVPHPVSESQNHPSKELEQQALSSEISDNHAHLTAQVRSEEEEESFDDQKQLLFASVDPVGGFEIDDDGQCRQGASDQNELGFSFEMMDTSVGQVTTSVVMEEESSDGTGPTLLENELQLASVDSVSGFEFEDEPCRDEDFYFKKNLTLESSVSDGQATKVVESEERTQEGTSDQTALQCSLMDSVGADLSTVSVSHSSSSAVVVTGKLEGGNDVGSLEKGGDENKVEEESQINLEFPSSDVEMKGLELCREEARIATDEGPLDQNELQQSLVDSVGADLCAVSISHSSSSAVVVTAKPGINESGDDDASLEKVGDENVVEKESQVDLDFPISHLDGAETKGIEIFSEEAKICKESMIKTEGCKGSESSDSSSSEEEEGEVGNLETRVEKPRIAKECIPRKSESSESESSETDDDEEEGDACSFGKPGEVARIAKKPMLSSESEESSESSSSSSSSEDEDEVMEDYEEGELKESPIRGKKARPKNHDIAVADDDDDDIEEYEEPIRGKNELKVQPRVPQVSVVLEPHHKPVPAGVICSAVGLCLVVEGTEGHEALNEGSILWLTEQRLPLGIVDELFGPVKKPFYVVRYNDASEVPEGAKEGVDVSYVPEFAEPVLNNPDLYKKAYDASGENDEELSEAEIEFSDDEKEVLYKKSRARTKRGHPEKCTQENDKQSRGSKNRGKRRQGVHPREVNNRHQMKEGNRNLPHSNHERAFFQRATGNHAPQFQRHRDPGLQRCQTGVEDVQTMPPSVQQSQHPSVSQSPSYHQAPLQQAQHPSVSCLAQQLQHPSVSHFVQQSHHPSVSQSPSYHQAPLKQSQPSSVSQPPIYHQTPLQQSQHPSVGHSAQHSQLPSVSHSVQQSQHPSVSQSPSYHQAPLQHFSAPSQPQLAQQTAQVTPAFGPPFPSGVATVQAMPNYMQYSEQPPVYQSPVYQQAPQQDFPYRIQPQPSRQAIQVPSSFGMPLSNQSPQFLNKATTNSLYTGMQVSSVPSPVLGIPAGPVNTLNYSTQLGFNQSFSPSVSPLPSYRGNLNTLAAWGFPEQSRHPQLHPGMPPFPLQQQPTQQGPPFFFDQRPISRQG